jgi:hypothetical protein
VQKKDSTPLTAGLGLAAIGLAGVLLGHLSWPIGGFLFVAGGGSAAWVWRRSRPTGAEPAGPKIESGLRMAEKQLAGDKKGLPHALRITISTEVAVELGLRVVCENPINELEALAQTGRGAGARQGVPPAVRESRQSCLFVMRNAPGQRELFLRVDLFSTQPIQVRRVEQIRPGGKVVLPEWKELEPVRTAPEAQGVAVASEGPAPAAVPAPEGPAPAAAPGVAAPAAAPRVAPAPASAPVAGAPPPPAAVPAGSANPAASGGSVPSGPGPEA